MAFGELIERPDRAEERIACTSVAARDQSSSTQAWLRGITKRSGQAAGSPPTARSRSNAVVSGRSLAEISVRLGLGRYVLLGKGETSDGGREKTRLLAELFEAVAGAIYLDGGPEAARAFVLAHLRDDIEKAVVEL